MYPLVDTDSCITCGICEKVCPVINPYNSHDPIKCLAARNKDENIRLNSSSGGLFSVLAEKIIEENGVVFGARYDDNWQVLMDYSESKDGLAAFRGSKYVQANTGDTYKLCEEFLKLGRKVLYSGTPCQISGLKHYLRKEYDNLLTVDFVCHGVPSPKVWRRYLDEICDNHQPNNISMRNKTVGWKNYQITIEYKTENNSSVVLTCHHDKNEYIKAFIYGMTLRPSCHQCLYKNCRSHSDITLADFWGIHHFHPDFDDDKGVSQILVNSQKGLNAIPLHLVKYIETTEHEGYSHNPAIFESARPWSRRKQFFDGLDNADSIVAHINFCLRPTVSMRIRHILWLPKHALYLLYKSTMKLLNRNDD